MVLAHYAEPQGGKACEAGLKRKTMKQLFTILLSAVALCACDPAIDAPNNEKPPRPENALSTLTEDLQLNFNENATLVYADCFGDYYKTGLYMWQLYFMEFESKEQLCIEVMVEPNDLVVPTGTFTATSNLYQKNGMLQGIIDDEGYDAYSWYTRINSLSQILARAPIAEGSVTIVANDDGTHTATFALKDDALNNITGSYTGAFIVEDFR